MIGRLKGQILEKTPPQLLLDVQGVGYELEVPMSTFYELPPLGETTVVVVHMLVREDAQLLYGFGSEQERMLFRALLKVNGVGAKVALAILSTMNSAEFALCIEREDVAALIRVPGVGKKTAERLLVEMRDRLDSLPASLPATESKLPTDDADSAGSAALPVNSRSQAIEALVALGYKPLEATKMIDRVKASVGDEDGPKRVEDLIRAALKHSV